MTELLAIALCLISYAVYRVVLELIASAYLNGLERGHAATVAVYESQLPQVMESVYMQGVQDAARDVQQQMPGMLKEFYRRGRVDVMLPTIYQMN